MGDYILGASFGALGWVFVSRVQALEAKKPEPYLDPKAGKTLGRRVRGSGFRA